MLATGGSAITAVKVLLSKGETFDKIKTNVGIPESRILFLNLICAPEGIAAFKDEFPELRIVTAFVDQGLDSRKYSLYNYVTLILDSWFLGAATLEIGFLERTKIAIVKVLPVEENFAFSL